MNKAPSSPILRTLEAILEGRTGALVLSAIVIPLLVIFALFLPPISLPQRILSAGYTSVSAKGASVSADDGAALSVPQGATKGGTSIKLTSMTRDEFLKNGLAQTLPATLEVKSPLYQPNVQGQPPTLAVLSIPLPEAADPWTTLDVYGYVSEKWVKLPFQLHADSPDRENQRIEVSLIGTIPEAVAVAQTKAAKPLASAEISSAGVLPASAVGALAEVNPVGLTIADGGGVAGNMPAVAEAGASSPYQVLPNVSNLVGGQLRSDLTDQMITDTKIRKQHVQTLVDLAVEKLYPGLNIDYQGATPDNKNDFAAFVRELAQALHAKDKLLAVTLAMPVQKTPDTWDTGSFDWAAIGQYADIVRIPLPLSRQAYEGSPSQVQTYLQWAVGQVDRYKLQISFPASPRDEVAGSYSPLSYSTALNLVGPLSTSNQSGQVIFDLPKLRDSGLKYDSMTGLFTFSYQDEKGQQHTVYLENADSLAKRLALANRYNLRGVVLEDVLPNGMDARAWDALKQFRQGQTPEVTSSFAIVWRINGNVVGKSSGNDLRFTWSAPPGSSDAKVEAAFSFDDGQSATGSTGPMSIQVVALAATPTPTPGKGTTTPKAQATPTAKASGGVNPTPAPTGPPPTKAPVVVNTAGRASFGYGLQVTGGDPGTEAAELKSLGFNWVKIQVPWQDFESSKGVANLSSVDNFVNIMSANGIKILLSIVKAPAWSRRQNGLISQGNGPPDNMQDAADFMSGVAAMYCGRVGAIEVWNEENLDVEWHDKRGVSAALYMDMLKKAYASIKAKCPSMIVVSGAPTPTGGGGATAIDDVEYLRQLYANGLKNYADAIGAHPSGFRSSPECKLSTAGCAGPYADHRSFFFRDTMESYHAVMAQFGDGNKQIWATEFGWPVGTGGGAHPAGQYNNAETVAGYYQRAFQWAKQQAWAGPMFAWQWDFSGGEVGAFRIKGAPAENALRTMGK